MKEKVLGTKNIGAGHQLLLVLVDEGCYHVRNVDVNGYVATSRFFETLEHAEQYFYMQSYPEQRYG